MQPEQATLHSVCEAMNSLEYLARNSPHMLFAKCYSETVNHYALLAHKNIVKTIRLNMYFMIITAPIVPLSL